MAPSSVGMISIRGMISDVQSQCRRWVRIDNTQSERNESVYPPIADLRANMVLFRSVPTGDIRVARRLRRGHSTFSSRRNRQHAIPQHGEMAVAAVDSIGQLDQFLFCVFTRVAKVDAPSVFGLIMFPHRAARFRA